MDTMDSVSSSNSNNASRFRHSQPISDRILRALRHRLLLLHRSDASFFILGATGNVYTVTLSSFPSCSCPDRTTPCKHILFVFIRVLGVSIDDVCLRRRTLRPCHLRRLLTSPTSPDSVAGAGLRQRFHELFFAGRHGSVGGGDNNSIEVEEGATCPICLEEMVGKEDKVVACATCRNPIHEVCLVKWKRSRGRRLASCVICRARWRDHHNRNNNNDHHHHLRDNNKYLNLSAYVDMPHNDGPPCTG